MNLAVTETYDANALDNLLLSLYQLGGEIFSQDDWISCIVNTSKRPDNYIKQIEKLEAIKKKFKVEDPIKLLAHWYFHKKISIHHIATHFLDGIYKEKALYVFLSKQL